MVGGAGLGGAEKAAAAAGVGSVLGMSSSFLQSLHISWPHWWPLVTLVHFGVVAQRRGL